MRIGDPVKPRNCLVHTRIVFHRAGSQRIHSEIDSVVPRRKPREVTDNFNLADLGHVAEIFSLCVPQELVRIYVRDIKCSQLPCGFAGRRLLEDQAFILVDVAGGLAGHVLHGATSSGSSRALLTERSLSATWPTAVSMVLREVNSVQHHNDAFPSSG